MQQTRRIVLTLGVPLVAVSMLIAGCETKQQQGTVAGAAVGAGVGSLFGKGSGRIWAIAGGAVVGGFVGNKIGKNMDKEDERRAQAAAREAETAPVGTEVTWSNPDSGNNGSIQVVQEGQDASGNNCREVRHTVNAGGESEVDTGVICQRADGKWVTVDYD